VQPRPAEELEIDTIRAIIIALKKNSNHSAESHQMTRSLPAVRFPKPAATLPATTITLPWGIRLTLSLFGGGVSTQHRNCRAYSPTFEQVGRNVQRFARPIVVWHEPRQPKLRYFFQSLGSRGWIFQIIGFVNLPVGMVDLSIQLRQKWPNPAPVLWRSPDIPPRENRSYRH